MKTSFVFKKKDKVADAPEASTTYFGCPDLDRVFGFQLAQGCCMLLTEAGDSRHSLCLARYFLGYGLHKSEASAVFDLDAAEWMHLIPKPMEKRKLEKLHGNKKEQGLDHKIAWRYSATSAGYTKPELRPDYTVLDLSKNEAASDLKDKKVFFRDLCEAESLKEVYEKVEADCQSLVDNPDDSATKRILLTGIDHLLLKSPREDVLKLARGIKILARSSRTVFLVRIDPCSLKLPSIRPQFEAFFDIVMQCTILHSSLLLSR